MLALPGHTSEQRTGKNQKPPLDRKSPIQVRIHLPPAGSLLRTGFRADLQKRVFAFDTIEGSLSWDADGATNGTSGLLLQWINHELVPVYPSADAADAPEIAKPAWGE